LLTAARLTRLSQEELQVHTTTINILQVACILLQYKARGLPSASALLRSSLILDHQGQVMEQVSSAFITLSKLLLVHEAHPLCVLVACFARSRHPFSEPPLRPSQPGGHPPPGEHAAARRGHHVRPAPFTRLASASSSRARPGDASPLPDHAALSLGGDAFEGALRSI
jgi:hypothetical protein